MVWHGEHGTLVSYSPAKYDSCNWRERIPDGYLNWSKYVKHKNERANLVRRLREGREKAMTYRDGDFGAGESRGLG